MCFSIFTDSRGVKKRDPVGTPKLGFRVITCVVWPGAPNSLPFGCCTLLSFRGFICRQELCDLICLISDQAGTWCL